MRVRVLIGLALTFGLIPTFVECRDATQMIVEVTTDVPCGQHPNTNIAVGKLGSLAGKTTTTTELCTANGTIGTLVIVPSGEDNDEVAFEVTTGIGVDPSSCANASNRTCIVARRDLHFLPHETVRITVPMKQICAGVSCEPDSTCYAGACVSATIDQGRCVEGVCGEDALGPAPLPDAGPDVRTPTDTSAPDGRLITDAGSAFDVAPVDTGAETGADAGAGFTGDVTDMVMGEDHTCMLTGGKVYCWGWNHDGQIGINVSAANDYPIPMLTHAPINVGSIATSQNTSLAVTQSGELHMWGYAGSGAILNSGAVDAVREPKRVVDAKFPAAGASAACVGRDHGCVVDKNDPASVVCWGSVFGNTPGAIDPTPFTFGAVVATLSCGDFTTVVRTPDGAFYTMGRSSEALGRDAGDSDTFDAGYGLFPVPGVVGRTNATTGVEDTIALAMDGGDPIGWGTNLGPTEPLGGNQDFGQRPNPVTLQPGFYDRFSKVVIGYLHACGLRGTEVYCWGDNSVGQTADSQSRSVPPHKVPLPGAVDKLWGGGNHNCARLAADKSVYCWGANDHGQLGNGTVTASIAHPAPARLVAPAP